MGASTKATIQRKNIDDRSTKADPTGATSESRAIGAGSTPARRRETMQLRERYGPWAVVTGASSGIGAEFARQLAAAGVHLVLASRRTDRLEFLADRLEADHGIETRVVGIDLSTAEGVRQLLLETEDLDVGLLVPAAGMEHHGAFLGHEAEQSARLLAVNVRAPMELARAFGVRMVRRRRGGIVFVSSLAAAGPLPYLAHYAASKAYVQSLGEALHREMRPHGVDVTVLTPGLTDTPMARNAELTGIDWSRTPFDFMEADEVVRHGLRALGRRSVVVPGWKNRILFWLAGVVGRGLCAEVFGGIFARVLPRHQRERTEPRSARAWLWDTRALDFPRAA